MKKSLGCVLLASATVLAFPNVGYSQIIQGILGNSSTSCSSWLDINPPMEFKSGEKIKIRLIQKPTKVLIRFLPFSGDPNDYKQLEGGPIDFPKNEDLVIELQQNHPETKQISVHGGPKPWGIFDLGAGNGCPVIDRIERVP